MGNNFKYNKLYFYQLFDAKIDFEETGGLALKTKIVTGTGTKYKRKIITRTGIAYKRKIITRTRRI